MDIPILIYTVGLFLSMLLLWKFGEYTVNLALQIATLFGLTTLFSGFVIMAVATGIPELAIAVSSVISGAVELSAGDIIGSNTIDITLVLGLVVLFAKKVPIDKKDHQNVVVIHLIAMLVMVAIFLAGEIGRIAGIFLMVSYIVCLWWIWKHRLAPRGSTEELAEADDEREKYQRRTFWERKTGTIILFTACMGVVLLASKGVVMCAMNVSELFGFGLETIGDTVVAIGTSLPELALGLNAVRQKEYGLALGNCLGSVLEQGTFILGALAAMSPVTISLVNLRSVAPWMLAAFAIIGFGIIKRKKLDRIEGTLLLIIFFGFFLQQLFPFSSLFATLSTH